MATAWVVYESIFGNTRAVAEAIVGALEPRVEVELYEASTAPKAPAGLDLLLLGGPTHAFGMSRPGTRASGAQSAEHSVELPEAGIREWLDRQDPGVPSIPFAAFDTRVRRPRVPGSAGKHAARALRRRGWTEIAAPVSFWVNGVEGPLLDGELARARAWALDLADVITGAGAPDAT